MANRTCLNAMLCVHYPPSLSPPSLSLFTFHFKNFTKRRNLDSCQGNMHKRSVSFTSCSCVSISRQHWVLRTYTLKATFLTSPHLEPVLTVRCFTTFDVEQLTNLLSSWAITCFSSTLPHGFIKLIIFAHYIVF
jgi:hypothetical protein